MGRGPWENVTGREIALVREMNLSIILNCLRETSPLLRAQLAEITGLNKTTVSSVVRELIARQFVRKIGFDSSESRVQEETSHDERGKEPRQRNRGSGQATRHTDPKPF